MRYLSKHIENDLEKKMVFVGGPRQVGKTTLAKDLLKSNFPKGTYFNWDFDEDRRDILSKRWKDDANLIVFDELHKYPKWKNWIKGLYDVYNREHSFLVTGSARLDVYKKGGDSLIGRYHYRRLHPFGLDELPPGMSPKEVLKRLMKVGGFPEPFLDEDEREARRWKRERFDRVIREDIRDLTSLRNVALVQLLLNQLRSRVGSLVVVSNLATEIQISPKTASTWIEILEKMYLVFRVMPYTKNLPRAILKPSKVFFFDNSDVIGDEGAVFENLVASHLLKKINFLQDRDGYDYELRYLRDKEGREVDFVIIRDSKVEELIEVKFSDKNVSKSLKYYAEILKPEKATQIVHGLKRPFSSGNINVVDPVEYFLR